MGERESLLLVLAVIYLAECFFWVGRGSVAFVNWWGLAKGRWRLWHPGSTLGNQHGGFFLANPLPPLGAVVLGQPFPLSISPDAVFAYTASCLNPAWRPAQSGRFVRFDDVKAIERDGKKVFVNGVFFFKALSPFAARRLVAWLRRLQETKAKDRAVVIRKTLAGAFDIGRVRARLDEFDRLSRPLHTLTNGLFFYLFLLCPAVVWWFGLSRTIWFLVAGVLCQTVPIAIQFRRAHGILFPDGGEERFTPFLTMLLAPPSAIRARDVLAKPLLEEFHALAAAQALCPPGDFREFARRTLLDLRHPMYPICPSSTPDAAATERWFRNVLTEAAERCVANAGLSVSELVRPPAPSEMVNVAYCPRCDAQFVRKNGVCGNCGGHPLVAWLAEGFESRR